MVTACVGTFLPLLVVCVGVCHKYGIVEKATGLITNLQLHCIKCKVALQPCCICKELKSDIQD